MEIVNKENKRVLKKRGEKRGKIEKQKGIKSLFIHSQQGYYLAFFKFKSIVENFESLWVFFTQNTIGFHLKPMVRVLFKFSWKFRSIFKFFESSKRYFYAMYKIYEYFVYF